MIYRRKLISFTHHIDFASSLTEALFKLDRREYDTVLISHTLRKVEDPYTTPDTLREAGYSNPIIVLAPGNNLDQLTSSYSSEVSSVISKGLNKEDFASKVKQAVNGHLNTNKGYGVSI